MKRKFLLFLFAAVLLSLTIVPTLSVGAEDPWKVLDGFTPVPRSLTRVGEHYVGMLFVNREERLVAAVIFNATCADADCRLNHRAGFAVTNAEGSNTRLYVDPREKELMEIMGSAYVHYPTIPF
jgi:hypothetical protein